MTETPSSADNPTTPGTMRGADYGKGAGTAYGQLPIPDSPEVARAETERVRAANLDRSEE